jgi:lysophospholipase L1-like esterase
MPARRRKRLPGNDATGPGNVGIAPPDVFQVAAFGDSVMWGQGLARDQTFAALIANELAADAKKNGVIAVNRSRSGAKILDRGNDRANFLDLFPTLFKSNGQRRRFLDGTDESPATNLYGEIPAAFPTVRWQVDVVDPDLGKRIDVVLLSGGGNDADFDLVLNPQQFPGAFIEEWDGKIRAIAHRDLLAQIQRTRLKCPNAVILVFGYYAPLSHASNNADIKAFFKHEADDDVGWWINERFGFIDIDRKILEAKVRSVWAQSRAAHWMRKAVTDANRDATVRGPGVLFIPSGMTPDNAALAATPLVHEDYLHPTTDAAQKQRVATCPREPLLDKLRGGYAVLNHPLLAASKTKGLRDALDGPTSLVEALSQAIKTDGTGDRRVAVDLLGDEIQRIQRALIASFLHPNPAGARRYADIGVARYRQHRKRTAAITKDEHSGGPKPLPGDLETLGDKLKRYGLRSSGALLADIGHLDVDSLSLIVVTERASDLMLTPDMSLVIATRAAGVVGDRRYQLNFPYRIKLIPPGPGNPNFTIVVVKKFYPHFEPAATNRFTIDTANGLRLDEITGIKIEMGPDQLAGQLLDGPHGSIWRPKRVNLEINGVQVLDRTFRNRVVQPGGSLDLTYPPPPPKGPVVVRRKGAVEAPAVTSAGAGNQR